MEQIIFSVFGDIFAEIGAREPQKAASEAFTVFGEAHRNIDKQGLKLLRVLHPMLNDLSTYLNKASSLAKKCQKYCAFSHLGNSGYKADNKEISRCKVRILVVLPETERNG